MPRTKVILNHDEVIIGRGAHIGCDCKLNVTSKFHLGNFSMISSNFIAIGQNHTLNNVVTYSLGRGPFGFLGKDCDPVATEGIWIGSDVWIGTRVIVLQNVKINHGAVVAAGSVVTKDVAPYSIVAGNPAREIKKRFPPKTIDFLLELKWWEWSSKKIFEHRRFFLNNLSNKNVEEIKELLKRI